MKMIGFRDSEADLAVIDDVCRELTEKGLTPLQAQVEVVSQMATQALQQGADQKEVMDALDYKKPISSESRKQLLVLLKSQSGSLDMAGHSATMTTSPWRLSVAAMPR